MNQILVTKKLYVTPELKRKKKIYKFDFILSIFLVIILISFYIYAEYDRNKSEEVSQEILASMEKEQKEDNTTAKSNILVAILNEDEEDSTTNIQQVIEKTNEIQNQNNESTHSITQTTAKGTKYIADAKVVIPKINVEYPVILGETGTIEEIEELLKTSPVKFHGGDPNTVGNYCIVGHNYRNRLFFSKVPTLENGDIIELTEMNGKNKGRTITYSVYDKYTVVPEDVSCTSQLTNGKKEVTLITCTDDSKLRVIVKAREVK